MLRIGVISDEISQDLDVAIRLAKEFDLNAVEIRSVWDKGPFELDDSDIQKIHSAVLNAGMQVSAISAPFFKCEIDSKDEVSQHLIGLEHCIHMAQMLQTNIIRGFTFWKSPAFTMEKIIERFQKPVEMLKAAGMVMALESDPSVNASSAAELAAVIEAIGSPQIKALWDPGNHIYTPGAEIPYPDGYAIIRSHIAHVHLKDAVLGSDGQAVGCRFGEGLVDFRGQLKSLINDGYAGYIVMETHYRKTHALSKASLERPGGSGFSMDGYEPTKESLESLKAMLQSLR